MGRAWWLCLAFLVSLSTLSAAGDIQVSCPPGLRVYLDGKLMGTSSAKEDGLYLVGVPSGEHTIRVEKEGFVPQSFKVGVEDLPIEVKVDELQPAPEPPPARAPAPTALPDRAGLGADLPVQVGRLVVTSAPQNCVVQIHGRTETKTTPQLTLGGLPAGEHVISFSKPGYDSISGAVVVPPGGEVMVRGDLTAGRVETMHPGKGSLRVISKPEHCTIHFSGRTREKIHPRWNLSHIPAGMHDLVVSWRGREVSSPVLIMNGHRTIVQVSFMPEDEPIVISHEPE